MKKNKQFKLSNIKFHERMLLIYIIGGIIPFVLAFSYTYRQNTNALLAQQKNAQAEEVSLICSGIRESMNVAEYVAEQIYNDDKVKEIASKVSRKAYKKASQYEKDCENLDFMDEYAQYYKQEISSIKIYVKNKTIISNKYFSYVGGDMKKLSWYIPTYYRNGNNFWYYNYDEMGTNKVMQLTRLLQDDKGAEIGVVAIQLRAKRTIEKVSARKDDTALLYNEKDILSTSFRVENDHEYIFDQLAQYTATRANKKVIKGIKEYLVSYERVQTDQPYNYFTVVSIIDYQQLQSGVYKTGFVSICILAAGLLLSVALIIFFSDRFGKRISMLRAQMHLVATGRYNDVKPIEGSDEVAQLYQELEKMMADIQNLTSSVVKEKVQKEKLHTKQKEVEFKMLASQINPHFLYNTLETIRMKAKINKEPEIEELVKMLAKIMRRNIQVGEQMVTLQSEIELIENYFVIQNYRFGDRIHTEVIVDANVDVNIEVIPLIMQPFVENAFVHGLEAKESDGKLQVHVMQDGKNICIEIKDNGAGMNIYKLGNIRRSLQEGKNFEKGHIGINNINQRLKILYGKDYGVNIQSREGKGTCVTINFPIKNEEQNL